VVTERPADNGLILASASPRRRELLARFGLPFSVVVADVDEGWQARESPSDAAVRLARLKALAVRSRYPNHWIVGADTVVAVDGQALGKPANPDQARAMLGRLADRMHQVHCAIALAGPGEFLEQRLSTTTVTFGSWPESWLSWYAASGDPLDKAGAYGIQNEPGIWVRRIDGSYSGVVGLPLYETGELLRQAGLIGHYSGK